jgi:hypothetical protein
MLIVQATILDLAFDPRRKVEHEAQRAFVSASSPPFCVDSLGSFFPVLLGSLGVEAFEDDPL